jgi:predicted nucleotidyltransferase
MYGLSQKNIADIITVISHVAEIEKVIIYGSGAKGNFKDGSDIDITLIGNSLSLKVVYALEEELDELYLPYRFDISIFSQIDNAELVKHIVNCGKTFYSKDEYLTNTNTNTKK